MKPVGIWCNSILIFAPVLFQPPDIVLHHFDPLHNICVGLDNQVEVLAGSLELLQQSRIFLGLLLELSFLFAQIIPEIP